MGSINATAPGLWPSSLSSEPPMMQSPAPAETPAALPELGSSLLDPALPDRSSQPGETPDAARAVLLGQYPVGLKEIVQGNRADTKYDSVNDHKAGTPLQWAYDFACAAGTSVRAVADGIVVSADDSLTGNFLGYGNEITVQSVGVNGQIYYTTYAHLQAGSVPFEGGESIHAGQVIAVSGDTGTLGHAHLHLQFGTALYKPNLDTTHHTHAVQVADGSADAFAPAYFPTLTMRYDAPLNAADRIYIGTDGADLFFGNKLGDTVFGGLGDDQITLRSGNDYAEAGAGNDTVEGGAGNNTILGGDGADRITVGNSDSGASALFGEGGDDDISAFSYYFRHVTVSGGAGADTIQLGYGTGGVDGGDGNDLVIDNYGGTFQITLGAGADTFEPGIWYGYAGLVTILDFQTGAQGDKLDLGKVLDGEGSYGIEGWDGTTNPFTAGYLSLVKRGADTVLRVNWDASGDGFHDLITFAGTKVAKFTAYNLGGYAPAVHEKAHGSHEAAPHGFQPAGPAPVGEPEPERSPVDYLIHPDPLHDYHGFIA